MNKFACTHCDAAFQRNFNLKRHLEAVHKITQRWEVNLCMTCPLCGDKCSSQKTLCLHAQEDHQDQGNFALKRWKFPTRAEFENFLIQIEERYSVRLMIRSVSQHTQYFRCHLAGKPHECDHEVAPNMARKKRITPYCTAFLNATEDNDGTIRAQGCLEHAGHAVSNEFLPLRKTHIDTIIDMRKKGMKPCNIVSNLQETYWDINKSPTKQPRLFYIKIREVRDVLRKLKNVAVGDKTELTDHDYLNDSTNTVEDHHVDVSFGDMGDPEPYPPSPVKVKKTPTVPAVTMPKIKKEDRKIIHKELKEMLDVIESVSAKMVCSGDIFQLKDIRNRVQSIVMGLPRGSVSEDILAKVDDFATRACPSKSTDINVWGDEDDSVCSYETPPKLLAGMHNTPDVNDEYMELEEVRSVRSAHLALSPTNSRCTNVSRPGNPDGNLPYQREEQRSPSKTQQQLPSHTPMPQNAVFRRTVPNFKFSDVDEIERDYINRKRRLTKRFDVLKHTLARSNQGFLVPERIELFPSSSRQVTQEIPSVTRTPNRV